MAIRLQVTTDCHDPGGPRPLLGDGPAIRRPPPPDGFPRWWSDH